MRYAVILLTLCAPLILAAGCASDRDPDPVRVTVVNPPPQPVAVQAPPTVIVEERSRTVEAPTATQPGTTATTARPPVHGERYRVDDVDVIYSEPIRAYTVSGYNDYYYLNGRFYRYDRDAWYYSPHIRNDARWVRMRNEDVPQTLVILHR